MARLTGVIQTLLPFRDFLPATHWLAEIRDKQALASDCIAGLTGAAFALPQGVAFAIIAGLPPEYGLYTAIVCSVVAAIFGDSRQMVTGPTTAISILVFSTVSQHAVPGTDRFVALALTLTFLVGVFQVGFALLRAGRLANFVSHSVIVGFTAGAAVLIVTSQVRHVFGLDLAEGLSAFETWEALVNRISSVNVASASLCFATLAVIVGFRRFLPRSPFMLIALVGGSLVAYLIDARAFGIAYLPGIPDSLPAPTLPALDSRSLKLLSTDALAIAVFGIIEAISIAQAMSLKTQHPVNVTREVNGQGMANLIGSFVGGYAVSGSFTRSGLNFQAGAVTPLAVIISSVLLAFAAWLAAPLASEIPMPVLSGVILFVAYRLIDWGQIREILQADLREACVLGTTFVGTLVLDLEFAILGGVFLSLIFYLNRSSSPAVFRLAPDPDQPNRRLVHRDIKALETCPQFEIVGIRGPLFFGGISYVTECFREVRRRSLRCRHLLVEAKGISVIDVAAAEFLRAEARIWQRRGGSLTISGISHHDRNLLKRGGYLRVIGEENIFLSKSDAIAEITDRLDRSVCAHCRLDVFSECSRLKAARQVQDLEDDLPEPAIAAAQEARAG